MNYNKVILGGNLTRDPEVSTVGEYRVSKMAIAVNNGYGDKQKTAFVEIEAWLPHLVDFSEKYLKKGSNVLVEGNIYQDTWEKDGVKRSKLFVKISELRSDKKSEGPEDKPTKSAKQAEEVVDNSDSTPF